MLLFLRKHPSQWTQVLLSLTDESCALLIEVFERMSDDEVCSEPVKPARMVSKAKLQEQESDEDSAFRSPSTFPWMDASTSLNDREVNSNASTKMNEYDAFYENLFSPCGDSIPLVYSR